MYFFSILRLESISVRGLFSYKICTIETVNPVFVLSDNDLIAGNYWARKNVPLFHSVIVNNRKQNAPENKMHFKESINQMDHYYHIWVIDLI